MPIKSVNPKPIKTDTTLVSKKMSLDTPMGKIESDSGNHLIDVASIVFIIIIFFVIKRLFKVA